MSHVIVRVEEMMGNVKQRNVGGGGGQKKQTQLCEWRRFESDMVVVQVLMIQVPDGFLASLEPSGFKCIYVFKSQLGALRCELLCSDPSTEWCFN